MDEKMKHLSVRVNEIDLAKFRYVCKYNDRSANGMIRTYIKKSIIDFEKKNGEIVKAEYGRYL